MARWISSSDMAAALRGGAAGDGDGRASAATEAPGASPPGAVAAPASMLSTSARGTVIRPLP